MVKDGRSSAVHMDFCAIPTEQNKGFRSLTDHVVNTPTLVLELFGTSACAYILLPYKDTNRNHGYDLRGVEAIATRVQKSSIGVSLTTERNWHSFYLGNRGEMIKDF